MGNCQAIDAATLVIQHPGGKVENLYWPISASEVMKTNPGHYVALLLSTTLYPPNNVNNNGTQCPNKEAATTDVTTKAATTDTKSNPLRVTRIKLLRPTDTLALGHCYRLVTTQDVMKGLCAKKQGKLLKNQPESAVKPERKKEKPGSGEGRRSLEKANQVTRNERNQARTTSSTNHGTARPRTWQPSLKSISEAGNNRS